MKTISLIPGTKVHDRPIDHIPVRGADTGIPIGRLTGFVMRNQAEDPLGYWLHGELVVHNDWRLRALQERLGVPLSPDPLSLILVAVLH